MQAEDGASPPAGSSIPSMSKGDVEAELTLMEEILCDIR